MVDGVIESIAITHAINAGIDLAATLAEGAGSSARSNMVSTRTDEQQAAFNKTMTDKGYGIQTIGQKTSYYHPSDQDNPAFTEIKRDKKNSDKRDFHVRDESSATNPEVIKDYMEAMGASGGKVHIKNKKNPERKEIQAMLYLAAKAENVSHKGAVRKSNFPKNVLESADEKLQAVYRENHPARGQKPPSGADDEDVQLFRFNPVSGGKGPSNSITNSLEGMSDEKLKEWDKNWGKYTQVGNQFFYPKDSKTPAFERNDNNIHVMSDNPEVISDLVQDAKDRKISPMNLQFPKDSLVGAMLYAKAAAEDIPTTGFTPDPAVLAKAQEKLGLTPTQQMDFGAAPAFVVQPAPKRTSEKEKPLLDEPLVEDQSVSHSITNSLEGMSEKDREAWNPNWDKYKKVGDQFFHPNNLETPAFERNGSHISVMSDDPEVISDLVQDAKDRKISPMNLQFPKDNLVGAMLYAKAAAEGIPTIGVTPDPAVLAKAQEKLGITPTQQMDFGAAPTRVQQTTPKPTLEKEKEKPLPAVSTEDEPVLPEHPVEAISTDANGEQISPPPDVHRAVNDVNKKLALLERDAKNGKLDPSQLEKAKGEAINDFVAHLESLGYKVIVVKANEQNQALQPQSNGVQLKTDSLTQQESISKAISPPAQQEKEKSLSTVSTEDEPVLPEHPVEAFSTDAKGNQIPSPPDVQRAVNDVNKKLALLERDAKSGKLNPGELEKAKGEAIKDFVAHLESLGYKVIVIKANEQNQALQPQGKGIQLQTGSLAQEENISKAITTQQNITKPAYDSFATLSGPNLEQGLEDREYKQIGNDFFHPRDKGKAAFSKNESGGIDLRMETNEAFKDVLSVALNNKKNKTEGEIKIDHASETVANKLWPVAILQDLPVTITDHTPSEEAINKVCAVLVKRSDPQPRDPIVKKEYDPKITVSDVNDNDSVKKGDKLFTNPANGDTYIREFHQEDKPPKDQAPKGTWSVKRVTSEQLKVMGLENHQTCARGTVTDALTIGQTAEQAKQEKLSQVQKTPSIAPASPGSGRKIT